jgi:hypothetical protein
MKPGFYTKIYTEVGAAASLFHMAVVIVVLKGVVLHEKQISEPSGRIAS